MTGKKSGEEKKRNSCNRFDFPENIVRVTAGNGGEALLILGSEKTVLVDCGMAYCAKKHFPHRICSAKQQFPL